MGVDLGLKSIVAVAFVPSRNDEVKDLNGKQIKLLELFWARHHEVSGLIGVMLHTNELNDSVRTQDDALSSVSSRHGCFVRCIQKEYDRPNSSRGASSAVVHKTLLGSRTISLV
jgi:uncharacterized protein YvpB